MQLSLWNNFSKRKNSTKLPGSPDAVLDVKLKNDTSIEKPTFTITGNNFNYNYAYALGHYYYITDIVSRANGLMDIICEQDLLATYKSNIMNTNAFVVRGSSNYNIWLNDGYIAAKNTKVITETASSISIFNQNGCYVVNLVSKEPGTTGFVTSFVLGYGNMTGLVQKLLNIGDSALDLIGKWILKPYDAIVSVTWIPLAFATAITKCTASRMYIGLYDTENDGYKITDNTPLIHAVTVAVPHRYKDFRDGNGFTKIKLKIPYFGIIDLDPNELIDASALYCTLSFDVQTGDTTLLIQKNNANGVLLHSVKYTTGLSCPIAQLTTDVGGTIASVGGAVTSFAAGGAVGALSGFVSAASAITSMGSVTASYNGGINGRSQSAFASNFILTVETYDSEQDPEDATFIAVNGRPVMENGTLSNYGGYIQTSDASVNMAGLAGDKSTINGMLDSGIFIE